jgi:hypothetical protein
MSKTTKSRLSALEAAHAERTRPQSIPVAYCPFLPGGHYWLTVPESGERKEFSTESELFDFMNGRGPWDGLLISPGLQTEADWLAAAAQGMGAEAKAPSC